MEKELAEVARRFLKYSFYDIPRREWITYNKLTDRERELCSHEEFQRLLAWVQGHE